MILSDLHIHSTYCDGKSTLEQTVKAAINMGLESIGFSGHSYTAFDTSYCMSHNGTVQYINEVQKLKKQYADKIKIYLGIERDFYSADTRADYDYVIGSVHYIYVNGSYLPIDESGEVLKQICDKYFNSNYIELVKAYYKNAVCVAKKTRADITGHFDLITKFCGSGLFSSDDAEYKKIAENAVQSAAEYCNLFEMNTGAISRGYKKEPYPSRFLIETIKDCNGRIILSSDSHSEKTLCYMFDECISILKSVGYKSVTVFENKKFVEKDI